MDTTAPTDLDARDQRRANRACACNGTGKLPGPVPRLPALAVCGLSLRTVSQPLGHQPNGAIRHRRVEVTTPRGAAGARRRQSRKTNVAVVRRPAVPFPPNNAHLALPTTSTREVHAKK